MHYTAINIYVNLKCNKEQQTIMHKVRMNEIICESNAKVRGNVQPL